MDWNPCRTCALAELQVSGPLLSDGYYRCSAGCRKVEALCERFKPDQLNQNFDI